MLCADRPRCLAALNDLFGFDIGAYFADYFAAHPVEIDPEPELPPETLEDLARGMRCLRDLPLYRPYLAEYGLEGQG